MDSFYLLSSIAQLCLLSISMTVSAFNSEACVFDKIFANYNKHVRPVAAKEDRVKFSLMFVFRSLSNIDEREETMNLVGYFRVKWNDFQLQWDPEECNGTDIIKISAKHLWLPEFIISNSIESYHQYTFKRDFGLWVQSNGSIHWAYGGQFSVNCELNLLRYPFDSQNCSIIIESWLHNGSELNVTVLPTESDTQTRENNPMWAKEQSEAVYYEVAKGWPGMKVSFTWKRKFQYPVFNIICPTIFVLLVAFGVFWLPAESGEKVSLAITVLLAFSVIQLVILDMMPANSDNVPYICLLVVTVMILSTLSVLTSMFVVYISHKPASTPVPRLIRRAMYGGLAFLTGLKGELPFESLKELDPDKNEYSANRDNYVTDSKVDANGEVHLHDVIGHFTHNATKQNGRPSLELPLGETDESFYGSHKGLEQVKLRVLKDILGQLTALVRIKEDEVHDEMAVAEWKVLAKITDRIIFLVCLISLSLWLAMTIL